MKQRIAYFDLLKGIAIFLVVMGHALTMCIRQIDAAFLFKIIGEIHMPIFFFISGFLTYKATADRDFVSPDLKKRFIQLIIPFFVVSALWIWYFPHSHLLSPISSCLQDMYCSYWKDGYWFTLCLFELFVICLPLSKTFSMLRSLWQQIAITIAVYAVLIILSAYVSFPDENFDIAGIGLLTRFFPIFMAGIFANKYKEAYHHICTDSLWFTIAVVAFTLSWYSVVYPWDLPMLPSWSKYIASPVEHLSLIVIAVAAISPWSAKEFAPGHRPSAVARYFDFLGKESLSIYLLHYFFLFPLTPLQVPLQEIGLPLVPLTLITAAIAFAVVAITLFVAHLIGKSRLLSLLLIGKNQF